MVDSPNTDLDSAWMAMGLRSVFDESTIMNFADVSGGGPLKVASNKKPWGQMIEMLYKHDHCVIVQTSKLDTKVHIRCCITTPPCTTSLVIGLGKTYCINVSMAPEDVLRKTSCFSYQISS